jgi:LIM domain
VSLDCHGREWWYRDRVRVSSSYYCVLDSLSAVTRTHLSFDPFTLPRQSFFHIDCFKCAKCHDRVTADTNLLLLSDGQPVCSNCSYSCSLCHQPILDEAIMTGDDSYHAHCFKCRSCHNRIDELMFAKTSHGIYCMKCHHQRVARSRRHAQKQKERENSGPTSTSSSSHGRLIKEQPGVSRVCHLLDDITLTPPTAYLSLPECAYRIIYLRFCASFTTVVRRCDACASFVLSAYACNTFRKQG